MILSSFCPPQMSKSLVLGRFHINPPLPDTLCGGQIPLFLEHGAFGSGDHETTASCLLIMESLDFASLPRVLDVGCGTGVLALAAIHLGAQHATCLDISEKAVQTTAANASRNHMSSQVTLVKGELHDLRCEPFDVILANIYGDVLRAEARTLVDLLNPGGRLLLSGVVLEDNFDIRRKYQAMGLELLQNKMLTDFSTLLFCKAGPEIPG